MKTALIKAPIVQRTAFFVCITLLASVTPAAYAATSDPVVDEAIAAIDDVAPEVFVDAVEIHDPQRGDSDVVHKRLGEVEVRLPVDPVDGISLESVAGGLTIGLPKAAGADHAMTAGGASVYDNGDDSITVPVLKSNGSVQINTVISAREAPQEYAYPLTLPPGSRVEEISRSSFVVLGKNDDVLGYIHPPWAKDARGEPVPTSYSFREGSLIQVVLHRSATTVYPVVADPQFSWFGVLPSITTTRSETAHLRALGIASATGGAATYCTNLGAKVGVAIGVLCVLNGLTIAVAANRIYSDGQCVRILIGPGILGAIGYKDRYCR